MAKPSNMVQTHELHSGLAPADLKAHMEPHVEPLLQRYPFVSKLSGGGVVVRVLKTPPTSRPLWGKFFGNSFHFARIPQGEDLSPWAPIMHGTIHPDGPGSRVVVELKPHPSARTLGGVYAFFGLLVLAAAGLGLSQGQPMAAVGLGFGILLLFFPGFRARYSFRVACHLALESLRAVVPHSVEDTASSTMSSGNDQRA